MVAAHMQGFEITAFDTDSERLSDRKAGVFDAAEPVIAEYLVKHGNKMNFTAQVSSLNICNLVVIALDTDTDPSGKVDLSFIESLANVVLAEVDRSIPVILMSQVAPGFTRRIGQGRANFFYQVETLIFGEGLKRALEPERIIFGCDKHQTIPLAVQAWHAAGKCPVFVMSIESAELAKMSINTLLAAQLITTSTLAEVAANVRADWSDIAETLRMDRRIGPNAYLTPGMGIGGTNIRRDLAGLKQISEEHGTPTQLFVDFLDSSDYYLAWMQRVVRDLMKRQPSISLSILGLAYKPGTMSSINSPGMCLARYYRYQIDVTVHDPHIKHTNSSSDRIRIAESAVEAVEKSNVIAIACPWAEYRQLAETILNWGGLALIDPNNFLKTLDKPRNRSFELHSLGRPISHPFRQRGPSP